MLLDWIRRRLANRRRAIFAYWDGDRMRWIDPIAALRAMKAHSKFDVDTHLLRAYQNDEAAIDITLEATREIFGVKAFDEGHGLTVDETLGLTTAFLEYLEALKKNTSPRPTLPESTEPPSSDAPSETTNALSDSGSTPSEPNSEEPAPS